MSPMNCISPKNHMSLATLLLAGSIGMEITLLAGIFSIGDTLYHLIHILLMGTLAGSLFSLHLHAQANGVANKVALLFAIGAAFTACGDFINGAVSHVEPVSLKLSWALLFFGIGYTLYNVALWKCGSAAQQAGRSALSGKRYLIAIAILALNVVSWFQHVEANTAVSDLLYYGSFVFNATIYVALPTFAIWFYLDSGRSVGGLLVLAGAILIPYSDLVLFGSWLRGGDPAVPSFQLYAYNWILYFGGQILVSLFPALVIEAETARRAGTRPV